MMHWYQENFAAIEDVARWLAVFFLVFFSTRLVFKVVRLRNGGASNDVV